MGRKVIFGDVFIYLQTDSDFTSSYSVCLEPAHVCELIIKSGIKSGKQGSKVLFVIGKNKEREMLGKRIE